MLYSLFIAALLTASAEGVAAAVPTAPAARILATTAADDSALAAGASATAAATIAEVVPEPLPSPPPVPRLSVPDSAARGNAQAFAASVLPTGKEALVTVVMRSGRRLHAQIDPATDARQLSLRWDRPGIQLREALDWGDVLELRVAEAILPGDAARAMVARIRAEFPLAPPPRPTRIVIVRPADASGPPAFSKVGPGTRGLPPAGQPLSVVRSLRVEAAAANFHGDVNADGLLLEVSPLDALGRAVATDGTLDVELWGLNEGPNGPPSDVQRLGSWSRRLTPADFAGGTARVRFDFQGFHPDSNRKIMSDAAVHVRLSVPGQGVFEATDDWVRLRRYSPVRDWLELSTGRRFLPGEGTSRGQR